MMETAEPWHRQDLMAAALILPCGMTRRRFLRQREMRPVLVIIADVLVHQTFQMPLVQDRHMIEQITAAVVDPTFGNAILPRTSKAGSLGLDAEALHCVDDFFIEVCTAIEDQIARSRVVGETHFKRGQVIKRGPNFLVPSKPESSLPLIQGPDRATRPLHPELLSTVLPGG